MREKRGARRLYSLAAALFIAALVPALPAQAATPTVTMFNSGIPDPATMLGITAGPDGKVWFADNLNKALGAVTLSSGSTNEIALPNVQTNIEQHPFGVTGGPNGRLYFSSGLNGIAWSVAGVMNPATGASGGTWYGGGNNALPRYPAVGPDGNIWFTEPRDTSLTTGDDKFGLIQANGNPDTGTGPSVFEVAPTLAGDNQEPEGITVGPGVSSGTPTPMLWATEFNVGKVVRIQPISIGGGGPNGTDGGLVDEYILPTGGSGPEGITPGPDGNIWFAEFNSSKVGRLIPPTSSAQGSPPVAIDEFPLPAGSNPVGIAAGPDGNLWVALSGPGPDGSVVRMNTSGQITGTFPTPELQQPYMITPAADGNLWFTSFSGARVGRITTALDPPAFQNTAQITVPASGDNGQGDTYPSNVSVSGLQGNVSKVTVRITGISHTFPDDLDFLLQGPQGQNVMLASDAGSPSGSTSYPANGITLNFDQNALRSLPDSDPLVSGFYKPTNNAPGVGPTTELSPPAPPAPYGTTLTNFNGTDPNGTWKLFVLDDNTHLAGNTNVGKIFGGWGLDIQTSTQLFVGKAGAGSGTVTSVPAGIDCGAVCTSSFASGSPVVLTATPSTGSLFAQWQGCDSVSGNQCTVNTDTDIKNVTASFGLTGGTGQIPANPAPTPAPAPTTKKKCKKAKKRSAAAAKKCKKRK
jgi:streptogramin lyase/subtilisin-like proprotein convertase family protein